MGNGLPGAALRVVELPNGNLVAAYRDVSWFGSQVAEWDGSTWTALGTATDQPIEAMLALPDGDLLIGGRFTTVGGVLAAGLARWRGGVWHAVPGVEGYVFALAMSSTGEIGVGGAFLAPAVGSVNFVSLTSGCAAMVTSTATACIGPAGPLQSTATALPWLGSTLRLRTSGYAAGSLAVVMAGFQATSVSLAAVHPAGLPGCSVLTSFDAVQLRVPVAGAVEVTIPIANSPALLGVTLRHQHLQAEFGAGGALVSLSSSNLLQSVVGDF